MKRRYFPRWYWMIGLGVLLGGQILGAVRNYIYWSVTTTHPSTDTLPLLNVLSHISTAALLLGFAWVCWVIPVLVAGDPAAHWHSTPRQQRRVLTAMLWLPLVFAVIFVLIVEVLLGLLAHLMGSPAPSARWASWGAPLMLVMLPAALIAVLLHGRVRARFDQTLQQRQVCYECGYDLRGNPAGPCPECGAESRPLQ